MTHPAAPPPSDRRRALLARRRATIGSRSPLFYETPLEFVRGSGVWLEEASGRRFLDAYNNVPHVGHCHPRVVEALGAQAATLNVHTRYLNERVLQYAEELLETFGGGLDRVFFTNSGSEANELALRLARQRTGATGVLVTDSSYHGNTITLAELTTGLTVAEPLGAHVRALHLPDLDRPGTDDGTDEDQVLRDGLAAVDHAIASLQEAGHGVSALLFDPLFSSEGLPRLPAGYVEGLCRRVQAAGGLVISDEVQSGFGRCGTVMWGHQLFDITPDLVTLGKPMGNGHPMGGVVTREELLEDFGRRNMYFNTFAGNPVSSAVGLAVLHVMRDEDLMGRAKRVGAALREEFLRLAAESAVTGAVKGQGLYLGLSFVEPDDPARANAPAAKAVVEGMVASDVLISRIGPDDDVLKIRPPLAFDDEHADLLVARLAPVLRAAGQRG
ncbi:aspartate aminotransferase family protein [Modestobacter roseus]|uniref:aspartate aminotransferase family protein n=1 Tax=Modestobacter roseus TaxID=1181884 RepID=UPI0034E03038